MVGHKRLSVLTFKLLKVAQNSSCMASPKNVNAYSSKTASIYSLL